MRYAPLLAIALTGCSPAPRSVDWFVEHPDEAGAVADRCLLHGQSGVGCAHAADALREIQRRRLEYFRKGF